MRVETAIAKRLKKKIVKELGSGGQGTAYLLNDGTVMKVTGQQTEYYTSTSIVGRKLKYICHIYATYRVIFEGDIHYAIIQEHLDTSISNELESFENLTYAHSVGRGLTNTGLKVNGNAMQRYRDKIKEFPHYEHLFKEYKNLAKASRRIGITNSDMYSGNIGQREKGGHLVVFDLGYSPTESKKEGITLDLTPKYTPPPRPPRRLHAIFGSIPFIIGSNPFIGLRKKELGLALAKIK